MWDRFRGPEPSHSGPPPSQTGAAVTSYALNRPGFSVRLDGASVDRRKWLMHAVVAYRPHLAVDPMHDVGTDARREVILAIARETRSARKRGARSIYVLVEGDDEVAGFFRMSRSRG